MVIHRENVCVAEETSPVRVTDLLNLRLRTYKPVRAHTFMELHVRINIWTCACAYTFGPANTHIYFWTRACAYTFGPEHAHMCLNLRARAHLLLRIYYSILSYLDPCAIRPHKGLGMSQSLPAQPISIRKAQSRKKPTNLCAPREFLKKTVYHV